MKKLTGLLICLLIVLENVSVFAQGDSVSEKIYTLTFGEASPSGYSDCNWVDENGNEVSFESGENDGGKTFRKNVFLPERYNGAEKGVVTEVKDQGTTGCCWAFSVVSAAESNLLKKSEDPSQELENIDLSEAHHVWFTHNSLVDDPSDPTSGDGVSVSEPYRSGGNWLRSTFSLARGSGFALESDYPFSENNVGAMGNYEESERYDSVYRLTESYTIPKDNTRAIKEKIMENGSVTAAFYMSGSFLTRTFGNYCYYCPDENGTNHQITVVGWDDNYDVANFTKSTPDSKGAWIVKNSYGGSWGNEGYFYLSYSDKSIDNFHALEVEDSEKFEKVYQYDGYGYGQTMSGMLSGEAIKTASFANVFTADEEEVIDRVSFYVANPTADYTVEIYKGLPENYATPVNNATCALSQSGSVNFSGYYTVDLDEQVRVKSGEIFSAVVTLTSDDGALIPVEGQSGLNDGSYNRYYSSSEGQSYYRFGTSSWNDSSSKGYNNVCVKAFASTPDTYEIANAEELVGFSNNVNSGKTFKGKTVILTSDIDMTDVAFAPIGTQDNFFDGTFDGDGYVIRNLNITAQDNAGLFGVTGSNSLIKLVGLENVSVGGKNNVGGLIGLSNSKKVYNCYCSGEVTGEENVGGLIGFNSSAATDNCFCVANVCATSNFGAFAGSGNSNYTNCYAIDGIPPLGNSAGVEGIASLTAEQFADGYAAYVLESANVVWTKGKNHPVFSKDEGDEVFRASVYVVTNTDLVYVYLTGREELKALMEEKYPGYSCTLYTDRTCNNEFTGSVTFNRALFAKIEEIKLELADGSDLKIKDGMITGIGQGTSVSELVAQFKNDNVFLKDLEGRELSGDDVVSTGFTVCAKNSAGSAVAEITAVVRGDLDSDGYVDAFDLSLLYSAVNFETDLGDNTAFFKAGDLNDDGTIDAFDSAALAPVVNFESEL